jgi:dTDP-N-acetylfucosamine:lipid II N-acetylfucosaminyltransferase
MYKAKKIILHGLFDPRLILLLAFQPWLIKKTCWAIWGGDLYSYRKKNINWSNWLKENFFKYMLARKIPLITTTVPGDFQLAQYYYKTSAEYISNLMYPSHLARFNEVNNANKGKEVVIQIGNSADPENNHLEIIDKLEKFKNDNIKVYAPLSYGDKKYGDAISRYGKIKFGEKFVPMREILKFEEYNNYLSKIDIVIFNHKRQQAMGNTIGLLSYGKKVYLRKDITPWKFFKDMKLSIFDSTAELSMELLDEKTKDDNVKICREEFCEMKLFEAWDIIFKKR